MSTKYSMQNNQNTTTWQEHLENNYQSAGTKTDMQDISKSNVLIQESKQQKADDFKYLPKPIKEVNKKKIENNTNAINRLEQEKKSLIERLENKIKDKQDLLKSKKNQDTKLATQLNMQISMLLYITQIIQDPKT